MKRGRYATALRSVRFILVILAALLSGECAALPGSASPQLLENGEEPVSEYRDERIGDVLSADDAGQKRILPSKGPYIALVIDDFGFSRKMTAEFESLRLPVTWAILPFERFSGYTAERAKETGIPYIIHLPMGAKSDTARAEGMEGNVVDTGMSPEEIADVLLNAVEVLPDAVGVNNHRGSRATADEELMDSFMEILSGFSLFFLDSRTSASSAAYAKAVEKGVPALYSSVFLDHQADETFMETQSLRALALAKRRGWVVVIAHTRIATLQYLKKLEGALPDGYIFVSLPDLFHLLRIR